jgi:hypothetical protein
MDIQAARVASGRETHLAAMQMLHLETPSLFEDKPRDVWSRCRKGALVNYMQPRHSESHLAIRSFARLEIRYSRK